jgi:pimeloyl-ACP methyl ester carboxylesterase
MRLALWLAVPALALVLTPARGDVLADAPSKFATADTGKVHYKSLGDGTTAVVFVHGWCCDHTVWRDQAATLAGKARAVYIDLPGYGKSDKPRIDYTVDVFAKGVDAVLRDAGVEKAVLVGHSMGTPVVLRYARLFPGRTKALVFVDGSVRPFNRNPAETEKFLASFQEDTFKDTAPKMLAGMFPPGAPAEARDRVAKLVAAADPPAAISSIRNLFGGKWATDEPVKVPAQALMAKAPMWTDEYKAAAKKLVPNLDYREFDGVGHFLFMEKPAEVNAALVEFLTKQGVVK